MMSLLKYIPPENHTYYRKLSDTELDRSPLLPTPPPTPRPFSHLIPSLDSERRTHAAPELIRALNFDG
ncbi:hypothetical protein PR048_020182 [Dryococelus australis]|uniref:Uncharacterized protein n=1 Tax=Dryococelus australis TaxID=614101 RepID=A0ABQ9H5K4_9NEOP|nr:hypothetical protein PR048_020182 [Dryococelus australis]